MVYSPQPAERSFPNLILKILSVEILGRLIGLMHSLPHLMQGRPCRPFRSEQVSRTSGEAKRAGISLLSLLPVRVEFTMDSHLTTVAMIGLTDLCTRRQCGELVIEGRGFPCEEPQGIALSP